MPGRNPNVLYELGLAHAIGKPTILISQTIDDVPFDLKHVRTLLYDTSKVRWVEHLTQSIKRAAIHVISDQQRVWPPPLVGTDPSASGEFLQIDKVAKLRWDGLTSEERARYYNEFMRLDLRLFKPRYKVVSLEKQVDLHQELPLEVSFLTEMLGAFDIDVSNIRLPLTPEEYEEIHELDIYCADELYARLVNESPDANQRTAIDAFYKYLSAAEMVASPADQRNCDVVIVPGARSGHIYRVDEACKIAQYSGAYVILSGMHPFHDEERRLGFGEADAMRYYLEETKGFHSTEKVIVEDRARNTRETATHIIPDLQRICLETGRPLRLVLVTSPYHMRRFFFLMTHCLRDFSEIIQSIRCSPSATAFDLQLFYDPDRFSEDKRRYGILLYIQEFFKLIGGRAVGEF